MTEKKELLAKLDEIESEMKTIGFWAASPPDLQTLAGQGGLKSYLDAPSFELWLQQIFLPNARTAIKTEALPKQSQVGLIALRQYDYMSFVPEAQRLTELLSQFDQMVCGNPS